RHMFCTWAVKRGVNLKAIAELMGHTSTAMVERTYTHIAGDVAFLQHAAQACVALKCNGKTQPLPLPTDPEAWQKMVLTKYPRAKPKHKPKPPGPRPPNSIERASYDAWRFAVQEVA